MMTLDRQRPRIRIILWRSVVLLSLLAAIGIAALAPRMAPVREGGSHAFWKLATGVNLAPELDDAWGGDAYFIDDTWAAYDWHHFHGSDIYRVSVSDALADFDAVVVALEQAVQRGEDTPFVKGYLNWRDDNDQPRDAPGLLESIKRARNRELVEEDVDLLAYSVANEQRFWRRWQRADWYWANIVFEWTFLSGLVLFTLWPGIRNHSALRWAIHVAFLPLLFLLPTHLGYATLSFTSAGPSGGVLYPFLLMFCRGGYVTAVDRWMLARLPQVLEPLSTPIGLPMALTGRGMPGPIYAVVTGVFAGAFMFTVISGYRRWVKRRL